MNARDSPLDHYYAAANAVEVIPLHVGLIGDAIAAGNDPRTLAAHFDGNARPAGAGSYDIGRLSSVGLEKKRDLFNRLRQQRSLMPSQYPCPPFLRLPSGRWARLNGKHRIGFFLYLGVESAHVAAFSTETMAPQIVDAVEADVSARERTG